MNISCYKRKTGLLLDDDKYFTNDGSNMHGNNNYYSHEKSKFPDSVRFAGKEKYPDKVMVWIAISNQSPRQSIRTSK